MKIGPYEDATLIGEGAFGQVFKALRADGSPVALKLMLRDDAFAHLEPTEVVRETFHRDYHIRASLFKKDDGIVQVIGFWSWEGRPVIEMEWMPGGSLEKKLGHGQTSLTVHESRRMASEICEILINCHKKGVVHRDVTPGNVLFDAGGHVKLTDFGLAFAESIPPGYKGISLRGWAIPAYSSSQQLKGDQADPRMDVFSAGVLLFQMLTGKLPYGMPYDDKNTILEKHQLALLNGVPSAKRLRGNRDLTRELDEIVQTAIHPEPANRFDSAEEFLQYLDNPEKWPGLLAFRNGRVGKAPGPPSPPHVHGLAESRGNGPTSTGQQESSGTVIQIQIGIFNLINSTLVSTWKSTIKILKMYYGLPPKPPQDIAPSSVPTVPTSGWLRFLSWLIWITPLAAAVSASEYFVAHAGYGGAGNVLGKVAMGLLVVALVGEFSRWKSHTTGFNGTMVGGVLLVLLSLIAAFASDTWTTGHHDFTLGVSLALLAMSITHIKP